MLHLVETLVTLLLFVPLILTSPLTRALVPLCKIGLHDWDMVFKKYDGTNFASALEYTIECSHCHRPK